MTEVTDELKRLALIAADLGLSAELRTKSIELMGKIGTSEAFHGLLELAGNEGLINRERDLALKQAREILKQSRQ